MTNRAIKRRVEFLLGQALRKTLLPSYQGVCWFFLDLKLSLPLYPQHWLEGIRNLASDKSNSYASASIFINNEFIKYLWENNHFYVAERVVQNCRKANKKMFKLTGMSLKRTGWGTEQDLPSPGDKTLSQEGEGE